MLSTLFYLLSSLSPLSLAASEASPSLQGLNEFLAAYQSYQYPHPQQPSLQNHFFTETLAPTKSAAIVFMPGMGEPSLKYYELSHDLPLDQTQLYFWDHIGQGFSSHLLESDRRKVHIDDFETHITGFIGFLQWLKTRHQNVFIIAHSMGGHVALRTAYRHPELIDKLVMTSPMLDFKPYISALSWAKPLISWFSPESSPPFSDFFSRFTKKGSRLTRSQKRRDFYHQLKQNHPTVARGFVTMGWFVAATASVEELKKEAQSSTPLPDILILEAEKEHLVSQKEQRLFCKNKPRCQHQLISQSQHEVLFETDQVRRRALKYIARFLNNGEKNNALHTPKPAGHPVGFILSNK